MRSGYPPAMSVVLVSLVALVGLAAAFDYTNGFHDSANSVATVVATGVLRPRLAVAWAAFWNFIAFLVFGTAVANTVAQTVKTPEIGLALIFAGLVGALAWNLASWHLGLPTSSTHALIGGLVGAALARGGWSAISVSNLTKTALFIVASPLLGMGVGVGLPCKFLQVEPGRGYVRPFQRETMSISWSRPTRSAGFRV